MLTSGLFTSNTDDWATPQAFFDGLNKEFNFELDVCANDQNHKCARYFTKEQDGLQMDWGGRLYGATHLMAEKLANGLLVAQTTTTPQLCSSQLAPIQGGSMTIFMAMQKYDLLKGG